VAAALNADDQGLARIAAVHLRLPDLPDRAARDAMEASDILIKYARDQSDAWNPALHPRAGTPPNPGWFAPTGGDGGESSSTRTAQNDDPTRRSDAGSSAGQDWARLRPGPKRIDELADFAEWFANATPQDEYAIRAEIKRYYADVGWDAAAHDLNAKLSVLLRSGVTREIRQRALDSIDLNAATYQNEASLAYRLNKYVDDVRDFDGARWARKNIRDTDIDGRAVQVIVPRGSITDAHRNVIDEVRANALKHNDRPADIIVTEH
jgi:hypothetical protein